MLGHDGPPQNFWRENLLTGEPLAECPLRTILRRADDAPAISRELDQMLGTYYPAYEKGHLLVAGGLSDQPARYIELLTLIDRVRARTEAKDMELREKKAQDEKRGGP